MDWQINVTKTAECKIEAFDNIIQRRIYNFLEKISRTINPRYTGIPLKGKEDDLWRYRVGDYRIICTIDDKHELIIVRDIGHRKDIYRKH